MKIRINLIIFSFLLFQLITFTVTAQSNDTSTTTEADPASTSVSPKDSDDAQQPENDQEDSQQDKSNQNKKDEPEPKVYIIHHHYRDPVDFDYVQQQHQQPSSNYGIPQEYNDPNYPFGGQQSTTLSPNETPQAKDNNRFDPLALFSDSQKKRQFFQDFLVNQLSKFESEIEPMIDVEENIREKNDMEEVLSAVQDLKKTLENHQIFNITELMNDWKEGNIKPQSNLSPENRRQQPSQENRLNSSNSPRVQHHFHYRRPPSMQNEHPTYYRMQPSPDYGYYRQPQYYRTGPSQTELNLYRPPPITRTYFMVPQATRAAPHYHSHMLPAERVMMPPAHVPMMMMNRRLVAQPYYSPKMRMYIPRNRMMGRSATGDDDEPENDNGEEFEIDAQPFISSLLSTVDDNSNNSTIDSAAENHASTGETLTINSEPGNQKQSFNVNKTQEMEQQ